MELLRTLDFLIKHMTCGSLRELGKAVHFCLASLSAYVGGLWIAALYAVSDMLKSTDSRPNLGSFASWIELEDNLVGLLERAKTVYHSQLWEGESRYF